MLKSATESISLPKLLSRLLSLLIDNKTRVISREELIDSLWKDKYVNENALSRTIAELRKELHDSASQPQFIKTLPKKGYQFIHPVIDIQEKQKKQKSNQISILFTSLLIISIFSAFYYFFNRQQPFSDLSQSLNKAHRITAEPGMEHQPNISPDGTKVAYSTMNNNHLATIIYDIQKQKQIRLISKEDASLSSAVFSHSGDEIIMAASGIDMKPQCQLLWKNLNTGDEKLLASCAIKSGSVILAWSADDNTVIYSAIETPSGTAALWGIDLNSLQKKQLTFPKSVDTFDVSPKISPNGEFLSFSRGNHLTRNIYIKKMDNIKQAATALTDNRHYTVSHDWFDDLHIIMDSDQTGERLLWLLNIENGLTQLVGARGAQFPSIDKSRNTLSYQVAQFDANIWMLDITSGQETRVINSTKYDNNPAFAPSGEKFAFTSNRQNHGIIWLFDFNTGKESKLFEIPNTKLTRPIWSSNGKKILVTANNQDGLWSYEFDMSTGNYHKLKFAAENFAAIYINNNIYAMSKPIHGESTILKLDTSGIMTQLNINGISRFMATADNKLVISKANKNGLFLIDQDGSNEEVLLKDFPAASLNHWSSTQSHVYYRDTYTKDQQTVLATWKIDINTLSKTKVSLSFPDCVGPSMSISTDQNRILITKTDSAESDIFMTTLD
ncbi:MAG: winged helix-turn-helix domain-containing protein [Alcanivoracaceae bacterium]|nr:winged helix-turn-helix domain-containing protein [Alcanivoracaceae bacterium]